ncbi:hypothetical protein ACF0H5_013170 [Mactra antiquata]
MRTFLSRHYLFLLLYGSVFLQASVSFADDTVKPLLNPASMNNTDDTNDYIITKNKMITCKLVPNVPEIREEIAHLANAEYKLVKLQIHIGGTNLTQNNIYSTSVYHPRDWIIATSATGKSMLMLREYFEPMSLSALGFGVAKLNISVEQQPSNCLEHVEKDQIESVLRESVLSNFGSESHLPETAEICNQHIVSRDRDVANLVYICCKNDFTKHGEVNCLENSETIWIRLLFISLCLIQACIFAISPIVLPDTLFQAKTVFTKYIFRTGNTKSFVLNVLTVDSKTDVSESFVKTRRHAFTHMTEFRKHLDNLTNGQIYTMFIEGVDMSLRQTKVIADGSAPVSTLGFIRKFFVRCSIRKEVHSVGKCCNAKLFKTCSSNIHLKWYSVLRIFMLIVSGVAVATPWIIRVWFYYTFEDEVNHQKADLYNALNLTMPFNGFLVSYLSPFHPLFIAIYILLGIEIIVYVPQPETVKRKLKFTVRKCFRDMRSSSNLDACGYFVSKMLYPLSRFGIVGCLIIPLWLILLPFLLCLLALETLPIANISIRLVVNLVYYVLRLISPRRFHSKSKEDNGMWTRWLNNRLSSILVTDYEERNTRSNQFVHAMSLIMTLVGIWCLLILTLECISFYAECIVYTMVGFILNPDNIMKYVSLMLLIGVYCYDCFSGVRKQYVEYGKAINSKVQELVEDRLKEVASQSAKDQVNAAFRIELEEDAEQMYLVAGSEGYLKWRAPRLVLFLDSSDIPYIPKSLLMRMGRLPHAMCPGRVHMLYLKAFFDFFMIVLVLLFVFIVIFAFGQAHDISSGSQTIAALGSGFLPLIFRRFVFKSHGGPSIDTSNMKWEYMFKNAVVKYDERWNFEDLFVRNIIEANGKRPVIARRSVPNEANESNITTENDTVSPDIALLSGDALQDRDVDLIVKSVRLKNGNTGLEFYVPKTRAAKVKDEEILQDSDIRETIV